jgi:hypothetical protein
MLSLCGDHVHPYVRLSVSIVYWIFTTLSVRIVHENLPSISDSNAAHSGLDEVIDILIHLSTAIVLTPGGSTHLHINNT